MIGESNLNFTNLPRALEGKREWGGRCYKEPSFPHQPPTGKTEVTAWDQGFLGTEVRRGSRREETPDNSLETVPQFLRNIKAKDSGAEWVEMGWNTQGLQDTKGL